MTYDEAVRFWYGRINYEQRAAKLEDLKLERMREFLQQLGNPQQHLRTVHIAGTKGKGSTAIMVAGLAQAAGCKVGLFTSPHLTHVEERVQVNGVPIGHDALARLMTHIRRVVETMDAGPFSPLTFFEIVTALGWLWFQEQKVDLAVMEVGLGGRFDSTNVCQPSVSVITSIGYDHMAQLGNTLEAIAFQKAGIIKPGVPVLSGVSEPGPRNVIRQVAQECHAPLRELEIDFPVWSGPLGMPGAHQARNAALAWETATMLLGASISPVPLATIQAPARIECVRQSPVVILDCAHNVPSVEALVSTLRERYPQCRGRTCIFAVSNDKQYEQMLPILATYFDRFLLTRYGQNPRCVPPEQLAKLLPPHVSVAVVVPAVEAWRTAKVNSMPEDLICITGSVFLAGELRATIHQ